MDFETMTDSELLSLRERLVLSKRETALNVLKGVQSFKDLPFVDRDVSWDSDAAEANVRSWAKADEGPNQKYARAFLWVDDENPDVFASYKLQFADVVNGQLVAVPRALFAVAGVLQGARGGVDVPSADQAKLMDIVSRYYAAMQDEFDDPSLTAPWDKEKFEKLDELFKMASIEMEKRHPKPFSSPGGKDVWVTTLKGLIPEHKTYVEPYAGSASLFWAKEPSEREVLCELNVEIMDTFMFLKTATDADFKWMRSRLWKHSESHFKRVLASKPTTLREKAYRYKYLNLFSVRGGCTHLDRSAVGKTLTGRTFLTRLEKFRDRIKDTILIRGDALKCMQKYDAPDTFFYIDPPWKPLGQRNSEWREFDEKAFEAATKALKGMALVSYQGALDFGDKWKSKDMTLNQGGFASASTQTLYTNYKIAAMDEDAEEAADAETKKRFGYDIELTIPFMKADEERRLVTGIVLEPDEVDSQNDTIKIEVIERAAYNFLARYNNGNKLGLMHRMFGDIGVELAESYIAPMDMKIGGQLVKKGSWIMTVKVHDEALWRKIKSGDITGFSIGGVAAVSE